MRDLELVLRQPGLPVLIDRRHAQTLVDRAFEERPVARQGGLVRGLLSAFSASAPRNREGEREECPATLAVPRVQWAGGSVEEGEGYCIVNGVAVIDIRGVLTPDGYYDWWEDRWVGGYAQIGSAFRAARADDRVSGIFPRVVSPGGLADGCFELADEIRNGRAAAGGKPVHVHTTLACSAAYALASGADRIVATRTADVGSIGVVILHMDMSEMLAEWGLKIEAIQSAARKTIGAMWKPLSDADREHFQAIVDEIARWFIACVEAGRGLSAEAIRKQEALWFMAQHSEPERSGLALRLVDEIATEEAAFRAFTESLSKKTGTGAPAGTGKDAADPAARASEPKETEMTLQERIAALQAKADAGDEAAKRKLTALTAQAEQEDEEEPAAGDEEDEEEEETAEGDDDKKEPDAKATGSKVGFALLDTKEAKGREGLARQLAAKVGSKKLTFGEAKAMLAAAPKASRLGEAMAGRDLNPGADAAGDRTAAANGWKKAVDRQNARIGGRK